MRKWRLIALLDILGFRQIVNSTPPSRLMAIFQTVRETIRHECAFAHNMSLISQLDSFSPPVNPVWDFDVRIFSDTIVLFSNNTLKEKLPFEVHGLCHVVISLHNRLLAEHGWLLRGAITKGELHVDGNIIFGKDLIRAYEAEQQQEWGAVTVLDDFVEMDHSQHLYTCEYDIPFKTGPRRGVALNLFALDGTTVPFRKAFKALRTLQHATSEARAALKLKNTVDFFTHVRRQNKSLIELMFSKESEAHLKARLEADKALLRMLESKSSPAK